PCTRASSAQRLDGFLAEISSGRPVGETGVATRARCEVFACRTRPPWRRFSLARKKSLASAARGGRGLDTMHPSTGERHGNAEPPAASEGDRTWKAGGPRHHGRRQRASDERSLARPCCRDADVSCHALATAAASPSRR